MFYLVCTVYVERPYDAHEALSAVDSRVAAKGSLLLSQRASDVLVTDSALLNVVFSVRPGCVLDRMWPVRLRDMVPERYGSLAEWELQLRGEVAAVSLRPMTKKTQPLRDIVDIGYATNFRITRRRYASCAVVHAP